MYAHSFGADDPSDAAPPRLSIHLFLNPVLDADTHTHAYVHHPPPKTRVVLPSIETLDLDRFYDLDSPLTPLSPLRYHYLPPSRPYQHQRRQYKEVRRRRRDPAKLSSSPSSASPSSSPASRAALQAACDSRGPAPRKSAHSNVKYTVEEVHFIQYMRDDKNMQWQDIVEPFNLQFPSHYRDKGALECRYYRAQFFPVLDPDGNPVFEANGEVAMTNIKVRDRKCQGEHFKQCLKLIDRCPQKVLEYSWTAEVDRQAARRISTSDLPIQAVPGTGANHR
jgi:hypothetical protein